MIKDTVYVWLKELSSFIRIYSTPKDLEGESTGVLNIYVQHGFQ